MKTLHFLSTRRVQLAATLLGLSLVCTAHAEQTIVFRSVIASDDYTSAGPPNRLDTSFIFELGAFRDGFEPTSENTDQWFSFWEAIGRTAYGSFNFFASSVQLIDNAAPFGFGDKAYIWGFNCSGEWILMQNSTHWRWPDANPANPGTGAITFALSPTQAGTEAIVGAVYGEGFQMMTAAVVGEVPNVDPGLWSAQHFDSDELADPDISGWDADPDGDGWRNLEELAGGSLPKDAASQPDISLEFVDDGGQRYAQLSMSRCGRASISHVLATGDDLATWQMDGSGVVVLEDTASSLVMRASDPVGTSLRKFYRFSLVAP